MFKKLIGLVLAASIAFIPKAEAQLGHEMMTNKNGSTLTEGDVVIVDSANATGFKTTTVAATKRVAGVVGQTSITNNATGLLYSVGSYVPVLKVTGAVAVGDYLITSTTAGRAQSNGSDGLAAFAIATTANASGLGTVECILLNPEGQLSSAANEVITGTWSYFSGATNGAFPKFTSTGGSLGNSILFQVSNTDITLNSGNVASELNLGVNDTNTGLLDIWAGGLSGHFYMWNTDANDGTFEYHGITLHSDGSSMDIGPNTDPDVLKIGANVTVTTNLSVNGSLTFSSPVPLTGGGTEKSLTAVNGGIVWTDANSMEVSAAGSSGQILRSAGTSAPTWSTATYPATAGSSGKILQSDGTNFGSSTPTFPTASPSAGTYLRGDGTNWITSTLILPNSATANRVPYATSSNTWGDSANFTFDGTTLTLGSTQAFTVASDTDATTILGRMRVHTSSATDRMQISHFDQTGSTAYALVQTAGGSTFVNAASGQTLTLRVAASTVSTISSTGEAVTGDLSNTGNATLGDASTDVHTVNGIVNSTTDIQINRISGGSSNGNMVLTYSDTQPSIVFRSGTTANSGATIFSQVNSTNHGFGIPDGDQFMVLNGLGAAFTVGNNSSSTDQEVRVTANSTLNIDPGNYTIATGSISCNASYAVVDTEASAASDDLDAVVNANVDDGAILIVKAANDARTVVCRHNIGANGFINSGAANKSLDDLSDMIVYVWNAGSSRWRQISVDP